MTQSSSCPLAGHLQHPRAVRRVSPGPLRSILLGAILCGSLNVSGATAAELDEATAKFQTGQYAECIADAEEEISEGSWNEQWPLLKIRAEMAVGMYTDARDTFEQALRRHPSSIRLRMLGEAVYRYNKQPEEAGLLMVSIESLARSSPWRYSDAANRVALGRYFIRRGADARQVLELFYDQAKKERPDYVEAYLASGELALAKHDYGLAAEAYEKAVELAPDDPDAHLGLAKSHQPSDPEKSAAELAAALERNPRHVDSILMQVDHLVDAEQYDEASERLDEVFRVNYLHPTAWAYEAVLAHLDGDMAGERLRRRAALLAWPANPEVDHLVGRKLSEKYRFAEGAEYQRRALKLDETYLPAKMQLAVDLLRLGEEDEGWQLADEVNASDGYNVVAHNLVTLRDALNDFRTLSADGFILRMEAREAELYGRRALDLLREAKRVLCEKYDVTLEDPIIVEIFPEQKDFAVRTFGMPGGAGFLGVCFGKVITANSPASQGTSPSNWEAVLWHEFCHVVTLHKSRNKMPRWLSEGISVYEERQADPSWGQSMTPVYQQMVLGDDLTPVSQLSGAFLRPESGLHLQFAYYESSLVVEYLVKTYGLETVRGMLDDLAIGLPIEAVLLRHTGSLEKLDANFEQFARERAEAFAPEAEWDDPELEPPLDVATLTEWLEMHPNNFPALQQLAELHIAQQNWEEAEKALLRLKDLYPEDTSGQGANRQLARVYRETGETDKERAVLEEVAEVVADAPEVYLRLAELATEAGQWEVVADNAHRMLAVNPLVAAPHRHLAVAAGRLDRPAQAAQALRAMLVLDPVDPAELHYRLAEQLARSGQREQARREVLRALEEAPRFRDAHRLLLSLVDETEQSADQTEQAAPAGAGTP